MSEEESGDFEIEDVENWRGEGEKKFSHQLLIMQAMDAVFKNGAKDLREGFWNTKIDKNGNAIKTYEEDTRKIFVGSIKGLMMLSHRDYKESKLYKPLIESKIKEIDVRKRHWMNEEIKWWNVLNPFQKQEMMKQGVNIVPGMFCKKLDFDNMYLNEEEELFREIATLIYDFIKDEMNDYEGTIYTA
jgi:hypothetical protein